MTALDHDEPCSWNKLKQPHPKSGKTPSKKQMKSILNRSVAITIKTAVSLASSGARLQLGEWLAQKSNVKQLMS